MKVARSSSWAVAAIAAATAAAVVGLATGLSPAPSEVDRLRDDAFYEFCWAANLAAGHGPVVGDGVATSGVQVLWCLLLVPVAWVAGAAALPVVAPWLGLLLHATTALGWWWTSRDRLAGLCAALCWLGNPLLVRECQNGQETALACLAAAALWWARESRERTFAGLGVLAVLARTDLALLVAALAVQRHGWRLQALLAPGLAGAAVVTAAWWLGGGLLPDSGTPMAWLWHANFAATAPSFADWCAQQWWFTRPVLLGGPYAMASAMGFGLVVFAVLRPHWPASLRALPALVVGVGSATGVRDLAVAGWLALGLALRPRTRPHHGPHGLGALLVASVAIVALHWAGRWYPRDYYAAPLVVAAVAALLRFGHLRWLLVAFAMAQLTDLRRVAPEPLRGQQELAMAGRFLGTVLPPDTRVGCFNSGLLTWHAEGHADGRVPRLGVRNLDGVVARSSLQALQAGRLAAHLDDLGIRFLVDNPVQFGLDPRLPHAVGRWFGGGFDPAQDLVELARFDVPGIDAGRPDSDSCRLYWRRGRGAMPERPAVAQDLGPAPRGGRYALWPARAGEVLEVELAPGLFRRLVAVEVDTAVVVLVPRADLGTGRLFRRGGSEPVLRLPVL